MKQESITMSFRGRTRTFPVASFAAAFRKPPEQVIRALDILVHGPPEHRTPPGTPPAHPTVLVDAEAPDNRRASARPSSPSPTSRGEGGKGGGAQEHTRQTHSSETSCLPDKTSRNKNTRHKNKNKGDGMSEGKGANAPGSSKASNLVQALGSDANAVAIERLANRHPAELLDEALRRTLAVPPSRVQTTRGALFTGIVRRLAREGWTPSQS